MTFTIPFLQCILQDLGNYVYQCGLNGLPKSIRLYMFFESHLCILVAIIVIVCEYTQQAIYSRGMMESASKSLIPLTITDFTYAA